MAASVGIKAGLINQCIFYDKQALLLTVGVEGCNLLQLSIKTQYATPQMALQLDPLGT